MNTNVNLWKTLPPLPSSTSLSSSTYDQIQKATEKFGPLGASWGWVPEILSEEVVVYVIVKLWYLLDGQRRETSGVGCRLWRIPSPSSTSFALRQFDESAPQKALSDAISNALSYLGFQSELLSSSDPPLSSIPPFKKQEKTEKKKAIQKLKEAYMRFPQGEAYFNLRLSELDIQNWSRELFNLLRIELESLSVPFIEKRLEKAKLQKEKAIQQVEEKALPVFSKKSLSIEEAYEELSLAPSGTKSSMSHMEALLDLCQGFSPFKTLTQMLKNCLKENTTLSREQWIHFSTQVVDYRNQQELFKKE